MRIHSMAAASCLFVALSVSLANAQESVKELAAKGSAELQLLTAFQTQERTISNMNHFIVYSIEAERGGWPLKNMWAEFSLRSSNAYLIKRESGDVEYDVVQANRSIMKSKVATEDELKSAEALMDNLNILLALVPQIADMITEGELDAAAVLYHETGQPAHDNALRAAQSGAGTVQKRLGKTLLNIRIAK